MSQRDLRTKNFPLLNRIERIEQKERNFENIGVEITPLNKKQLVTKLRLLDNKRRKR